MTVLNPSLIITPIHDVKRQLAGLPLWFRRVAQIATKLHWGSITAVLPDGRALRFEGANPGLEGVVVVRDFGFARRLIKGGNVGFAESYLAGHWETPDLAALLEVAARNSERVRDFFRGRPMLRAINRALQFLNANTRSGSRRNIEYHYDLGNAFYSAWLDPTMTYSAALFARDDMSLDEAQTLKYRSLASKMDLQSHHHVLEVGCGWGGFAEFAARDIGCKVTGITISPSQLEFARERIFKAGLNEKVDLRLQDYRDVSGRFDRIASIEMFEAVGRKFWPVYFNMLHDRLNDGGMAALQIITIQDRDFESYNANADFIRRYIFPGGMLPSPSALKTETERAGLKWIADHSFGLDYARTLDRWRKTFHAQWPQIEKLGFDERFRRMWEFYLSYCEAGFRAGNIDVAQIALSRA